MVYPTLQLLQNALELLYVFIHIILFLIFESVVIATLDLCLDVPLLEPEPAISMYCH